MGLGLRLDNISFSITFLITSNSVSRVSMLRLRSHLLCIEWTLPRCSKNTGQLVAPLARLVTAERIRRGNIFRPFLIYFRGSSEFREYSHLSQKCSSHWFQLSQQFIAGHIWCHICDITSIPMSRYSKRLRWFQCHQKLIYPIQSLTNQTSEFPRISLSEAAIVPDMYPVTICHDDNCQLCISRGL